jgi:hypothetical protein
VTGGSICWWVAPAGGGGAASSPAGEAGAEGVVAVGVGVTVAALELRIAGTAGAASGGGAALVAGGGLAGLAAAISEGSSDGRRETFANEVLGAGPIAAPTATPVASIATASAAATRGEGVLASGAGLSASGALSRTPAMGSVGGVSRWSGMTGGRRGRARSA